MQRRWVPWLVIGLLAGSCCVLGFLQYRWLTQFSMAQEERLRQDLQNRLNLLSRSFNDEISYSAGALTANESQIDQMGRDRAYAARYQMWRQSHDALFQRIALAIPERGNIILRLLDLNTAEFSYAEWPTQWSTLRDQLRSRIEGRPVSPSDPRALGLLEIPRFGRRGEQEWGEQEWLILELNLDYIRTSVLPEMLKKYVGDDYDAEAVASSDPSTIIFSTGSNGIAAHPDASVTLLEDPMRRPGPPSQGRGRFGPLQLFEKRGPPPQPRDRPPQPPGRWQLYVRHHGGSLEAVVAHTRSRNIAVASALLLLIMAAVITLMRVSRQAQRLAELQMNFVAGVSHELRTPLAVIRTAAYNLRGKLANRPDQVERYGSLIQEESEKLTAMVEQILRFAGNQAGHVIRDRQPTMIETIVESALDSTRPQIEQAGVVVEKKIPPDIPLVLVDQSAMKHAIQNLIENAIKYGTAETRWIGLTVSAAQSAVEIRVADRGPGIPDDELQHIFDPFFRGRAPVADQIHGTGLGLNLVKKIVEAHGGTVSVHSAPSKGTEFVVRIPAAPTEQQHEFAHSVS